MSLNRVEVPQATKESARFMSEPNEGTWNMLKRLIRYLVGHGRLVQVISEQRHVIAPRLDTDSDNAGCGLTRQSTTGAHLLRCVNLLKAGSWTQGTRSSSVAESEVYAGVKGASILLGAKSMMIDFGEDVGQCVSGTDSSSAKSVLKRRGAGRIRHLRCPMWCLSQRVNSGEIRTEKRKGEHNTAGMGTTVSAEVLRRHLKTRKMEWRDGRHL